MDRKIFTYVKQQFELIYGAGSCNDVAYGEEAGNPVCIGKGDLSFFDGSETCPMHYIHAEWQHQKIPFFFTPKMPEEMVEVREDRTIIHPDIIANAFFFLSGWQEYAFHKQNEANRFPYEESVHHKLNLTGLPVVNYYFDILRYAIEKGTGKKLEPKPGAFTVAVTHDIDRINSGWLEGGYRASRKLRPDLALQWMGRKILSKDIWNNLDEIMQWEIAHELRSTFFFLTEKGKKSGRSNADYNLAQVRPIIKTLQAKGFEIGVHGSIGSHKNKGQLRRELEKLDGSVKGNRFHFLQYNRTKTPGLLDETGLLYDSTLGFAERPGFRNGTCFPFHPYNFEEGIAHRHVEIPLILMDTTLRNYLKIPARDAFGHVQPVLEEIIRWQGCFTLLWHNNYFSEAKYAGWKEVFEEIIYYCKERGAVFLTGNEIATAVAGPI